MNKSAREPRVVTEQEALRDLDPHWRWNRALQAPGHTNVDFEVRVDFRRLHRYRLGRAKEALKASKLGALLVFDVNNIRYLTGTKIGEREAPQSSAASRCSPATMSRSCGTSAPRQCTTGSTAIGCRRPISAPACSVCAGQFLLRPA